MAASLSFGFSPAEVRGGHWSAAPCNELLLQARDQLLLCRGPLFSAERFWDLKTGLVDKLPQTSREHSIMKDQSFTRKGTNQKKGFNKRKCFNKTQGPQDQKNHKKDHKLGIFKDQSSTRRLAIHESTELPRSDLAPSSPPNDGGARVLFHSTSSQIWKVGGLDFLMNPPNPSPQEPDRVRVFSSPVQWRARKLRADVFVTHRCPNGRTEFRVSVPVPNSGNTYQRGSG